MESLAVFCGSSYGASPDYKEGAVRLGKELARREITLVYGGASVGMMGNVANTVLEEGGKAIGVIPKFMTEKEVPHQHLTELHIVETMHERKAMMMDLSDGFIALPGGPGTMEEFFEVYTWQKVGIQNKPCGLLNINGYFQPLITLFDHMVTEQFLQEKHRLMVLVDSSPGSLLDKFDIYQPPTVKTY